MFRRQSPLLTVKNLINGKWTTTERVNHIINPLNGKLMIKVANTQLKELEPFIKSFNNTPKGGLHNPLKNVERYRLYGEISAKMAHELKRPDVESYLSDLIMKVIPKNKEQAIGEIKVCQKFFENFSGDSIRFHMNSKSVAGDYYGQESKSYLFPYGPVVIIAPFNFPLEIPLLQMMGALYTGNRPTLKVDSKVSIVMQEVIKLLNYCGMPLQDVDLINCSGNTMNKFLLETKPPMTQFTGSSKIANKLAKELEGRIKIEDAGFGWKILGPDYKPEYFEHVMKTCDNDAYNSSGQKCSAQSILFVHKNWNPENVYTKLWYLAKQRNIKDLTIGPTLSIRNNKIKEHIENLLKINGSFVLFGNNEIENHTIPECYGSYMPTAIYIPFNKIGENFELVTKEIFGPFQIITTYDDKDIQKLLEYLKKLDHQLTGAIVSNDIAFQQKILSNTITGTTYCGIRARTTGAPQNHWFGPSGDPRSAGIGTPEAIKLVWTSHREIINDFF